MESASEVLMLNTPPDDASGSALFTSASRICGVCTTTFSRYKCPKCAMAYCSLACYRQHGEACTEGFYATHAKDALRSNVSPAEQRVEMLRTLQRLEQDESGGGGADDDSSDDDGDGGQAAETGDAERLAQLLEASTLDESALTERERTEFRRMLADGSLSAQLQTTPVWWLSVDGDAIAATSGHGWRYTSEAAEAAASHAGAPTLPPTLPLLRSLTTKEPPPSLLHNLLEVLCAYAYTTRLFCAATDDDPAEAAAALLALSAVLRNEQPGAHSSCEAALLCFASNAEGNLSVCTSASFGAACVADAASLAVHAGTAALALAGTTALLEAAAKLHRRHAPSPPRTAPKGGEEAGGAEKEKAPPASDRDEMRVALLRAKKKSRFLEVWWSAQAHAERQAALRTLQFALRREIERREGVRAASTSVRGGVEAPKAPPRTRAGVEEVPMRTRAGIEEIPNVV